MESFQGDGSVDSDLPGVPRRFRLWCSGSMLHGAACAPFNSFYCVFDCSPSNLGWFYRVGLDVLSGLLHVVSNLPSFIFDLAMVRSAPLLHGDARAAVFLLCSLLLCSRLWPGDFRASFCAVCLSGEIDDKGRIPKVVLPGSGFNRWEKPGERSMLEWAASLLLLLEEFPQSSVLL